ncbi:transposable element Tcb1 transposase [Trichonephila clavipes]|nr:transposable element Tcb1 transposase [Trichonephila clavipes]
MSTDLIQKYKSPFVTCTLSNREIGSRVGRNQTTVMRICDRWMQEATMDRRDRSHPPQCTTSHEDRQIVCMAVTERSVTSRTVAQHIESVTHHSVSARTIRRHFHRVVCLQYHDGRIRVWRHLGERMLNSCAVHHLTGPSPGIMGLATAIFQQDKARPHVTRIVQRFCINHQIEIIPWPSRLPELSPIENIWSMVAQRLIQITPSATTPDQFLQRVEATWSDVPQEHIQSLFELMPRRVEMEISNNVGFCGY